jgi:hypothetical protein
MDATASSIATQPTPSASERRRFPRYRYSAPIIVRPANSPELRGISLEISECGASLMVGAPLKVGDTVELEPIGGGRATAVVRRGFGKLFGFEFLQLSSEQAANIREMCKMLPPYRSKTLDLWER